MLSLDNIIPILLIADSLPTKSSRTAALFFGLLFGALLRCILVFFAAQLFSLGTIIYLISGVFLLYLGIKGLIKKEMDEKAHVKEIKHTHIVSIVISIVLIDISLSVDNIAALVGITQVFSLLVIGIIISVFILFGLSFGFNTILQRVKGLDIAAYLAIIFLGLKFLVYPFGINPSNMLTSLTIITICLVTVFVIYARKCLRVKGAIFSVTM